MFTIPRPSSSGSSIDITNLGELLRALEPILRFIYPALVPKSSSSGPNVDTANLGDLLRALEPILRFIYPTSVPQSSSSGSNIDIVNLGDPPRALGLVLRFIYPSPDPPVLDDLTVLSEALNLADKYDIEAARSRLRTSLVESAKTEPLRVYAIACRLGFKDGMKIAS